MDDIITLDYGSGGKKTAALIDEIIVPELGNAALNSLGDGAVLELWPYHLPDSSDRSEGIFVRFVNPEGKTYTYYTDRDTFARVTQCLSPENNPAWAE